MQRKQTETIRCQNCQQLPAEHRYGPDNSLLCDIDHLPLQVQECYYREPWANNALKPFAIYYPMNNLQLLEWEYQYRKELDETPTRESLR